jgi:hypothetical protein
LGAKLIGQFVLALMISGSALQAPMPLHRAALSRDSESFETCFARTQDRAGRPWAFIPSASGGTFTNLGASAGNAPYRLVVRAGLGDGSVRLTAPSPDRDLIAAVEQCR